jgi:uncharacterized phiE125 gp8 family phage protein
MLTLVAGPSVAVTGTTASGSAIVTGIADTAAISGAVTVSGAGIPPGTMVKSVDSATQVTLTANPTASGTVTLTFGIEVLSLQQAKKHLKIDADLTEDDDLIAALITAARRKCETETWRCFLTSTWDYAIDQFPYGWYGWQWGTRPDQLRIPNPPLVSVTSVTYIDTVGSSQVMSGSLYQAFPGTPGILLPVYGGIWPFEWSQPNGVVVRYVAGYGLADAVPATIKAAVKLLLAHFYYNRGDADAPLPQAVGALLAVDQHGAIA